jgi:nitronate monooxygenase
MRGGSLEEILPFVSGEAARKMYQTGDINAGTISISQGIGIPKQIMPVKDIVSEIIEQAQTIHKRMGSIGMAGH